MISKSVVAAGMIVVSNIALFLVIHQISRPLSVGLYSPAMGFTRSPVTIEEIPTYLASLEAMKDLPDDSLIQLKFYSMESGHRRWDKSYVIRTGIVEGSIPDADLDILLDSKYIPELNGGLCPVIQKARVNKDMGFMLNKKAATLLWKYREMLKYKACFGF